MGRIKETACITAGINLVDFQRDHEEDIEEEEESLRLDYARRKSRRRNEFFRFFYSFLRESRVPSHPPPFSIDR